jgi:hypothetical protein
MSRSEPSTPRPGGVLAGEPSPAASAAESGPGDAILAHPATGEIISIAGAPPAVLADAWTALRERERQLKEWRGLVEDQLRILLAVRQRRGAWPVGDFEISVKGGRYSEWDGEQLEIVLRELVDDGVVLAGEVTDVIRHETTVSASAADRLSRRLAGEAHRAVEACREWKDRRGSIEVVRSAQLPEPTE